MENKNIIIYYILAFFLFSQEAFSMENEDIREEGELRGSNNVSKQSPKLQPYTSPYDSVFPVGQWSKKDSRYDFIVYRKKSFTKPQDGVKFFLFRKLFKLFKK